MALAPSRPAIKLKALLRFPARVLEGAGIGIERANGNYTIGFDFPSLQDNAGIPDPSIYQLPFLNTATGQYEKAPLDQLRGTTVAAVRTAVGNADYSILSTDRYIGLTAALTAPRLWSLPAAAAVVGGTQIDIMDEAGGIGATNTLTIICTGAETIDGASSFVLNAAYAGVRLISDGIGVWTTALVGTANLAPKAVTNAKLADAPALSVLVNATNAAATPTYQAAGTDGHILRRSGTTLVWAPLDFGVAASITGTLGATNGGTGIAAYVVGDVLFANTTTSLAKLAGVATGNALISGGVGTAPAWDKIGLTTHVTGTLGVANGGTGITSATAYAVLCGGTTGTGAIQSVASVGTSGHVLTSNGPAVLPTFQALPSATAGSVVKSALSRNVTYAGGTTAMAGGNDTVPQITDGTEIISLAFTPTSATNILRITVTGPYSASSAVNQWVALFRDSTAAAKASQGIGTAVADSLANFAFQFEETSGSTSSTTYRLRIGNFNGGSATWAVNGTSSARRLGGSTGVVIKIEEIKV